MSQPCGPTQTDITGAQISYSRALSLPWRVDSQVGRTIYAKDPATGWGRLIGVMDTARLAHHTINVHNAQLRQAAQ